MKAIETTAVLDEAARIVPRQPLPEHPMGEFRVILLLEDSQNDPARPTHVSDKKSSYQESIHPEVLAITGLVPQTLDVQAEYRKHVLEKHGNFATRSFR